jgi:hypothetical protein
MYRHEIAVYFMSILTSLHLVMVYIDIHITAVTILVHQYNLNTCNSTAQKIDNIIKREMNKSCLFFVINFNGDSIINCTKYKKL